MAFEFVYEWQGKRFKVWERDGQGYARCLACGAELPPTPHSYDSKFVLTAAETACQVHLANCPGKK